MATKRNKRRKIKTTKRLHEGVRNLVTLSAILSTGAGKHGDRRFRRNRTRQSQKNNAIVDGG